MWIGTTPRGVSGVDVDVLVRLTSRACATLMYDLFVHVGSLTPSDRGGVVRETFVESSFREVALCGLVRRRRQAGAIAGCDRPVGWKGVARERA